MSASAGSKKRQKSPDSQTYIQLKSKTWKQGKYQSHRNLTCLIIAEIWRKASHGRGRQSLLPAIGMPGQSHTLLSVRLGRRQALQSGNSSTKSQATSPLLDLRIGSRHRLWQFLSVLCC